MAWAIGSGVLAEHANAENSDVGASFTNQGTYSDVFANGATLVTQSITITKQCCIVVVTLNINNGSTQKTQIQRVGVDKTKETTVSAIKFAVEAQYGHLQYATEILAAGTYTYNLVNTSGGNLNVYGSAMKIVAVSA